MKFITNYIKSLITDELIKDIRNEVLEELNLMPEYSDKIKKLKTKSYKDFTGWDALTKFKVNKLEMRITGKYNNGVSYEERFTKNSIQEMYQRLKEPIVIDSDVLGLEYINLNIWYQFKDNQELSVIYFNNHNRNNLVDVSSTRVLVDAFIEFIDKHPELLV